MYQIHSQPHVKSIWPACQTSSALQSSLFRQCASCRMHSVCLLNLFGILHITPDTFFIPVDFISSARSHRPLNRFGPIVESVRCVITPKVTKVTPHSTRVSLKHCPSNRFGPIVESVRHAITPKVSTGSATLHASLKHCPLNRFGLIVESVRCVITNYMHQTETVFEHDPMSANTRAR